MSNFRQTKTKLLKRIPPNRAKKTHQLYVLTNHTIGLQVTNSPFREFTLHLWGFHGIPIPKEVGTVPPTLDHLWGRSSLKQKPNNSPPKHPFALCIFIDPCQKKNPGQQKTIAPNLSRTNPPNWEISPLYDYDTAYIYAESVFHLVMSRTWDLCLTQPLRTLKKTFELYFSF